MNKWESYLETFEMENLSSLLEVTTRMKGELFSAFTGSEEASALRVPAPSL